MQCPKAALFDLDNTLAEPFRQINGAMAGKLGRLAGMVPVSIMTAASLERVQKDVLAQLPDDQDLGKIMLFTANAGQCFAYENGTWVQQYNFEFNESQLAQIRAAIGQSIVETNALADTTVFGEQFVDYKGYFAFTALGVGAPVAERRAWDPDFTKRTKLREAVQAKLRDFEVYIGGSTSIDVTFKGINKGYGIEWLSKKTGVPASDMLYVGDALYEGGNDYVVIGTGVQTRQTKSPEQTLTIVDELLSACSVKVIG